MKNMFKYVAIAFASFFVTACSDDYTDWANPLVNEEEAAITIPGYTATAVGAVDLADVEGSVKLFNLSEAALPEGFELQSARVEFTPSDVDGASTTEIEAGLDGTVAVSALQTLVEESYGKRPVARAFNGHVYASAVKNGEAALVDAGMISLEITPMAPQISERYYLIGAPSSWGLDDTSLVFNHSGNDVYEDPIFTITFPVEDGEIWFALTDDITIEHNDWSYVFGCCEGNGLNETEGKLARRSDLSDEGSWKIVVEGDAKMIRMTLNMMEYTYTIEKLNFTPFIYEIGNESDWGVSNPLAGPDFDGKYQGYYYLDGEFKFKPNADDWNNDLEYDGEGKIADIANGPNIPAVTGFYQIDVDMAAMTYALTEVKSITCVGNHNGWNQADADQHMTYNLEEKCWELTTNLVDGFKFAMNDGWEISWGGANGDPTSYDDLTRNNGKDLNAPEGEGTYHIKLYLSYEGANKVEFTKQ